MDNKKTISNHIARKASEMVQRRIDALKIGQKMQDLPEELWHESFRYYVKEASDRHGGPNLRMIRLDPNEPSLTVTGYIFNKFVHPFENRFITVREAARLQGFPDELEFKGPLTSTQQQVGNAVPIPLAEAVFREVLSMAEHAKIRKKRLNALSLFCGAGGLDIGAERAKTESGYSIHVRVANDCWRDACDTLKNYCGDRTLLLRRILQLLRIHSPFGLQIQKLKQDLTLFLAVRHVNRFRKLAVKKALMTNVGCSFMTLSGLLKSSYPRFS